MEKNDKKRLLSDYVKDDFASWSKYGYGIDKYAKEIVGVSRTVIFDILKGKYNSPSPLTAVRICDWFKISPEELCDMIENSDDEFIDVFMNKYNRGRFEENCKKILDYFVKSKDNSDYLYETDGLIEHSGSTDDYSLNNISFENTKEETLYNPNAYNALCSYSLYEVNNIYDGDEPGMIDPTGYIECSLIKSEEIALYYLPTIRIRKDKSRVYPDEGFRSFTNKLLYLLTSNNPPKNNIFITTSEALYDEILEYLNYPNVNHSQITVENKVGIAIIYTTYRRRERFGVIVRNDVIQNNMFSDILFG